MKKFGIFWVSFLFLLFAAPWVQAAEPSAGPKNRPKIEELETLLYSIQNLERKTSAMQEVLQKPQSAGREAELRVRINELRGKLKETRSDFERLSTGVDSFTPKAESQKEVNWNRELKTWDRRQNEVEAQTPDMVRLRLKGEATRSYKTQDYLSLSPTNLSKGFRIRAVFGLDYQHQASITEEIPRLMEEALMEGLRKQGYGDHIKRIEVEFMTAGASSMDVLIKAEFSGDTARWYQRLQRAIQRICVDACNTHGWVIPFQQVTVHMPEQSGQQDR
ncbi:MAG: hypothetical protein ACLFUL_03655 [Desulfobacteraceae bacterium]